MLYMHLLQGEEKLVPCKEYGYNPETTLVYCCETESFKNLVFFTFADYCLTLLKVVDDPADPKIFDFLVKGTLGYGEQHLALDVCFDESLDDNKLMIYGFLKDKTLRKVRLYTLGGGCAGCKHAEKQ